MINKILTIHVSIIPQYQIGHIKKMKNLTFNLLPFRIGFTRIIPDNSIC